jgi:hypothetical protein
MSLKELAGKVELGLGTMLQPQVCADNAFAARKKAQAVAKECREMARSHREEEWFVFIGVCNVLTDISKIARGSVASLIVTRSLRFTEPVSWISGAKFARLKRKGREGVMTKLVLKTAAMLAMSTLTGATANSRDLTVMAPILGKYPKTTVQLSGDKTVMPNSAPTNTTSINVSTSAAFKGKLEAYPTTGIVRVTNAHPAGVYTVTVKAFDSGGASVTKTFLLRVRTPATCDPVHFAAATNVAAGNGPYASAVGDFNGDGKQDLAVTNLGTNSVSILLGSGNGAFGAPGTFAVGSTPTSLAVGDFNGDGKQDLAVANLGSNTAGIYLGNGAGGFALSVNVRVGDGPYSVTVGDFNGDGKPDVATANFTSNNVSIALGDGTGHFGAATGFAAGMEAINIALGDFNGDGRQDLVAANYASDNVSVLLGNGDGTFSSAINLATGSEPASVSVGDFNNDGNQDLAVTNEESSNVSILLGDGAGHFGLPSNLVAGSGPRSLAIGDFNGDGNQDLAVANTGTNFVSMFLGDGNGGFGPATILGVGPNPYSAVVGDFNGDGKQDLATANNDFPNTGSVSILMRDCGL